MRLERQDLENIVRKEFEEKLSEKQKEKEVIEQEIVILKRNHTEELAKKEQSCIEMKNEMQKKLAKVYCRYEFFTPFSIIFSNKSFFNIDFFII